MPDRALARRADESRIRDAHEIIDWQLDFDAAGGGAEVDLVERARGFVDEDVERRPLLEGERGDAADLHAGERFGLALTRHAQLLRADGSREKLQIELRVGTNHHDQPALGRGVFAQDDKRSEEHTSELQSRFELVCRLLLEKKK